MALVCAALALLGLLAHPSPAAAQAVTTFISNTGQTTTFTSDLIQAVAFTTGTGTYTLSSVGIYLGSQTAGESGPPIPTVNIHEDNGGEPSTSIQIFMEDLPGTIQDNAVNSFTPPPDNTTLEPGTTYWVVINNTTTLNGTGLSVGLTNKILDTGTAVGWMLGNARSQDMYGADWTASNRRLRFEIRGIAMPVIATGAPMITGTTQVGQTLTAGTTAIMDANGLTTPGYTYQWIRTAAGVDTNISGATASTHTLVAADLGTTIKVTVSFTDDAGYVETLTSAPTAAVAAAPNTLPSASDGTVTTNEDTARTFAAADFNFSDTDPGDTLSNVRIVTLPASGTGTLAFSDTPVTAGQEIAEAVIGTLTYTPPANANGTDYASFTFKVSDGTAESAADYTMTINVTAVNDAPTVATAIPDQPATVGTAFSYAFPANTFSDADTGAMLSYTATKADGAALPTWLGFAAGTRTFSGTPQTADVGTVSVKVTASDGTGGSVSDDFDITVSAAANTLPLASDGTVTTDEDIAHMFTASEFNFSDADDDTLSNVKIVTLPALGTGTLALSGAPVTADQVVAATNIGTLTYTPPLNANGAGYASFTFKVSDGTAESAVAYTMTITVTAVNDAPTVATAIPNQPATVETAFSYAFPANTFSDADTGDTLTYMATKDGGAALPTWLTFAADTHTFSGTPQTADVGTVSVKVTASDGSGGSVSDEFDITVSAAANTLPLASDGTVTTDEDIAHMFTASEFNFSDADDDTLSNVKIVTLPALGTGTLALSGAPVTADQVVAATNIGTLTYTPPLNANGAGYASFTFKVSDGTAESAVAYTMTITVTAVNDAPTVATAIPNQPATVETAFSYAFPANTFSDADTGDTLTYMATKDGGATLPMWLAFAAGTHTFSGTPQTADVGTVSVKVTASDGNGGSVSDEFDITVSAAANTLPLASDGTVTTDEDIAHMFTASEFNFSDADDDTLSNVKIVTLPALGTGTLELSGAPVTADQVVAATNIGTLTYTPPLNANGAGYASFTFKVSDGTAESAVAYTMTITVTAVNDAPTVATAIPNQPATVETAFSYAFPANTFSDADTGDTLTYMATKDGGAALPTWLTFAADTHTFSGTPQTADVGTVSVKVTASDGSGGSVSDEFDITVSAAANTLPLASDGTVTTDEDIAHMFTASEFNFSDADDDTLSNVKIVTLPALGTGTLALSGAPVTADQVVAATNIGTLTYTPPLNANGAGYASFTFKVSDGTAESAVAYTMTITVTAVNDAPTVATAIQDQSATAGTAFSYAFPDTTFADADGDTLTYMATKTDDTALPTWLTFAASTHTFSGTPQTADVGTVSVKVTASDGSGGSVSDDFDITVSAAANTPATGALTITGTATVGQTLTAGTTGIMDADGLTSVSYAYQWIRVATDNTEMNISGAMASTHTLVMADQGMTIKVKVSFTDDLNNPETRTSAATAAVATAGSTPATGAPTITGTTQVGQTLTAGTTGIMDADGLTSVSYTYQWIRVDDNTETNISGATASTYTLVAADQGTTIKVTVSFTDDASNAETLTSAATATATITLVAPSTLRAWTSRFGRTVATHVTDAVGERLRQSPGEDSQVTVGGYRLPLGRHAAGAADPDATEPETTTDRLASLLTGLVGRVLGLAAPQGGDGTDPRVDEPDPRLGQSQPLQLPTIRLRDVLLGSSFRLALGDDDAAPGDLRLTAWGRVAGTQFSGRDGALTLDGNVLTGTVGVDSAWDRWLTGVAVSHSLGGGSFTGDRAGDFDSSTLTSLHPYLRYAFNERVDVWSVLGYGWGDMTLEPGTGGTLETDTTLLMGAFGGRGILLSAPDNAGFQLATRTDAMLTRMTSGAVAGLAATDAEAHRLRLVLEGTREVTWPEGQRVTPTVELGVRHDWGDAETGFGLELGGRVQYADPGHGLTIEVAVRGLLAHEDSDYKEWGASGTIRIDPGPTGQGLSLTLAPTWGAASSGIESLWARQTTAGLAPQGTRSAPTGRLNAEVSYGVAAPFGTGLLTPYVGTVLTDGAARTYRVGTRLELTGGWTTGMTLSLEGQRQEPVGPQPIYQGLQFQAAWGF